MALSGPNKVEEDEEEHESEQGGRNHPRLSRYGTRSTARRTTQAIVRTNLQQRFLYAFARRGRTSSLKVSYY